MAGNASWQIMMGDFGLLDSALWAGCGLQLQLQVQGCRGAGGGQLLVAAAAASPFVKLQINAASSEHERTELN